MARPATTLILVSRHTVVRADFRRGAVSFGEWSQPRLELPDLASVVEYAISLGPRPGRSVWVLATDLWTQTLALPVAKIAGLNSDDLGQALAFEAESYSGIPAYESSIGAVTFPPARGERPCWITQIRTPEREAIGDAVARAGGALAGIVHPAGLPRRLHGDDAGPFERLELWPDAVVGLRRNAEGQYEARVWNSDPPMNKWQADAATWLSAAPISNEAETLTADGLPEPKERLAPVIALDDAAALKKWLASWAALLAARDRGVPVIGAPQRALSAPARAMIALALMLVVAALCTVHGFTMKKQVDDLNAEFARGKTALKSAEDFNKLVDVKVAKREELRTERVKYEKDYAAVEKDLSVVRTDRAKVDRELKIQKDEERNTREMLEDKYQKLVVEKKNEVMVLAAGLEHQRGKHVQELQRHRVRFHRLLQELAKQKPDDLVIQKIDHAGNTLTVSGIALMPNHPDRYATDLAPVLRSCGWSVQPAKTAINKVDDVEVHSFSITISDLGKLPEPADAPPPREVRP